jgi:hypothetical protein
MTFVVQYTLYKAEECNYDFLVAALYQDVDGPSSQKHFLHERVSVDPPHDHCYLPQAQ